MMRNDTPPDLDAIDRALVNARVVARDAAHDDLRDREQWDALSQRLDLDDRTLVRLADRTRSPSRRPRDPHATWHRPWSVAGLIAVVLCVLGGGWIARRHMTPSRSGVAPLAYATGAGQFAVVVLSDSSRVTLAPHSRLVVPSDFGQRERVVSLVGEARFAVTPDRRMPLSVTTGAVTTRVLGTEFDIRRYARDVAGRIAVFSGKVATGARTASMTLTAGMSGQFTDTTVTTPVADDSTVFVDWDRGQLVFRDAPVELLFSTLHEWYGYEFQLADSTLAHHHISAVFVAGDTPRMFDVVRQILGVTITRHDSVLVLRPGQNVVSPRRPVRATRDTFLPSPTEVGR